MYRDYGHWSGGTKNRLLKPHYNDGLELVSITGGQFTWHVDDQPESVGAGDIFFTLPWQRHGSADQRATGATLCWVVIPTVPCAPTAAPEEWGFAPELGLSFTPEQMPRLMHAFATHQHRHRAEPSVHRAISNAVAAVASGDATYAACAVSLAVIETARAIESGGEHTTLTTHPGIERWLDAVRANPLGDLGLDAAAASAGLHRSRFAELVQLATGDSPMRFRTRQRVTLACRLLATSERSITDIAFSTGFASSQHFARVFKQYRGMTPTAYRTQH